MKNYPIRGGAEFTIYRGRQPGNTSAVCAVARTSEEPLPQGRTRLEHEYSLAAEFNPASAALTVVVSSKALRVSSCGGS